jgi:hypothetical protein
MRFSISTSSLAAAGAAFVLLWDMSVTMAAPTDDSLKIPAGA